VLTAIPARLAALLFVVAALFAPGASPAGALRVAWRDSGKHPSFSAGWPLAAVAGALDLALAGPDAQTGRKTDWIGSGRARATASDVSRVLYLFVVACLLVVAVAAGAVILSLTS
jgi:adenosylcobinamide-phosphate synthase